MKLLPVHCPRAIWSFVPFLLILLTCLPSTSADVICNFERNQSCGYEWQSNLLPFTLVDEFAHMSTLGMMLLDLKNVNLTIAPGARLYSRYYPSFALRDVSHFLINKLHLYKLTVLC